MCCCRFLHLVLLPVTGPDCSRPILLSYGYKQAVWRQERLFVFNELRTLSFHTFWDVL